MCKFVKKELCECCLLALSDRKHGSTQVFTCKCICNSSETYFTVLTICGPIEKLPHPVYDGDVHKKS